MRTHGVWRHIAVGALMIAVFLVAVPADAAISPAPIEGSGSSWAGNGIAQWSADEQPRGVDVSYTASGSAQGRRDFARGFVDFAVTDLQYQGGLDTPGNRAFEYVPIIAGGTAFPYHLRIDGQLVRDLRLSGATLAGIFTGTITDWSDPAITADNHRQLPALPITPIVDSQPADTSLVFTQYLASHYPAQWLQYSGLTSATATYPVASGFIAQNGSDSVMNVVTSAAGDGAIGLDQYSYALARNIPVAAMGTTAGTFALPTSANVTAGLDGDPKGYPLSSYDYFLLPTGSNDATMTSAKRQALADFLTFALCPGQGELASIGYAPLSTALVRQAFLSLARMAAADPAISAPAGCGQGNQSQIPMEAQDSTPPYVGQLSLAVTAEPIVPLAQVDPASAAGHPALATDPSGHRHAWVFQGDLTGIAIIDTRPDEPGWSLTAQATDFTGPTSLPVGDLGWTPRLVTDQSDAEGTVIPGATVASGLAALGSVGLSVSRIMGSAGAGSGLGTQNLGATLIWWVPDTTPRGTYTSTLTLTLTSP